MARTRYDELVELAMENDGLLTSGMAREAGIADSVLSRLAQRGRLRRMARGVYRIPYVPASRFGQYREAVLWAKAQGGPRQVVLSHETALIVLGISDANPRLIHLTVPRAARLRRRQPKGLKLHRAILATSETMVHRGVPLTTVARTVRDLLSAGTRIDLIKQAIGDARREGFVDDAETRRLRRLVKKHVEALEAS